MNWIIIQRIIKTPCLTGFECSPESLTKVEDLSIIILSVRIALDRDDKSVVWDSIYRLDYDKLI